MASITIKGLTKTFAPGDDDAPAAVAGLDLDIKDNQFITLLGPSGCGKIGRASCRERVLTGV